MDEHLTQLITSTYLLSPGDKSFLLDKLSQMSPFDKLKLKQSLMHGQAPAILQSLQLMRAKFFESEMPKKQDMISQIAATVLPKKPKKVLSASILTQPSILGGPIPQAPRNNNVRPLHSLSDFQDPNQLLMLNNNHVTFGLNDNVDQIVQNFLLKLDQVFENIDNINMRRNYFMSFLQSQLFSSYLNTGLTALRHPELEPAKIILNLLYQINPNYLNNKQFRQAAIISSHIRSLCGL